MKITCVQEEEEEEEKEEEERMPWEPRTKKPAKIREASPRAHSAIEEHPQVACNPMTHEPCHGRDGW
jgi:hypothetical protein